MPTPEPHVSRVRARGRGKKAKRQLNGARDAAPCHPPTRTPSSPITQLTQQHLQHVSASKFLSKWRLPVYLILPYCDQQDFVRHRDHVRSAKSASLRPNRPRCGAVFTMPPRFHRTHRRTGAVTSAETPRRDVTVTSAADAERVLELCALLLHLGVEVTVHGLVGPALAVELAAALLLRGAHHVRDGLTGGRGGGEGSSPNTA